MNNYSLILLLNNLESKSLKRSTYCQSALNFLAILDKFQQRYVIHMSQRNRQSAFRWHAVIWQYETSGFNGSRLCENSKIWIEIKLIPTAR